MKIRIVTWNLGFNTYRSVHDDAWRYLMSLNPDLALVQEAVVPDWVFQEANVVPARVGSDTKWRSSIISPRWQLAPLDDELKGATAVLGSYVASASITLPGLGSCLVASVHASPRAIEAGILADGDAARIRRKSVIPWYSDLVFDVLDRVSSQGHFAHQIVGGDWNEARAWDTVHGGAAGAEFFDRMENQGWVRCSVAPEETPTFFGPQGSRYQVDHVFVDPGLNQVEECLVLTRETSVTLSDHAPLMVRLTLDP